MLGFLLRCSKPFSKVYSYILLYQTLVRSHLEYVAPVWNPFYAVYSSRVEMVQKKFLRALHFRMTGSRMSYDALLTHYKMLSLSDRRCILGASTLHNICSGRYNCPSLLEQIYFSVPSRRTRSRELFAIPTTITNAGSRAPLYMMCYNYNKSLVSVDIFNTPISQFKGLLYKLYLDGAAT